MVVGIYFFLFKKLKQIFKYILYNVETPAELNLSNQEFREVSVLHQQLQCGVKISHFSCKYRHDAVNPF